MCPPDRTAGNGHPNRLSMMRRAARRLLRGLGLEIIRYSPRNFPPLRRPLLLRDERIDVVLDVGTSDGSWARALRATGYRGRIVSFEPLCQAVFDRDERWQWHKVALGDRPRRATLH